jgi:hypothetical protein
MEALIFNGTVVQIEENSFPVSSEMQWVTCDNTVVVGYLYSNNTFTAPIVTTSIGNIIQQLEDIDKRSIRALRTNDTALLTSLESQAAVLRAQL